MSTSIAEGPDAPCGPTPLDDYLRDEEMAARPHMSIDGLAASASLASEMSLLPSPPLDQPVAGPSRPATPSTNAETAVSRGAAFAEEFKYLVCSSGVLERNYVPGLGGRVVEAAEHKRRRRRDRAWDAVRAACGVARGRKDVGAAALVLVIALGAAVYQWATLGWIVGMVVATAVVAASRKQRIRTPARTDPPDRALAAVTAFLSASQGLDVSTDAAFAHLAPNPDTISSCHALRLALHELTRSTTDALAAATSQLLTLVDRDELAVLGEMYDIPVGTSFMYHRRTRKDGSIDLPNDSAPAKLSPTRPALTHRPSSDVSPQPAPTPTTPPFNSYPGRVRPGPSMPSPARSSPMFDMDDRFTKVPPRTPRLSKRASWSADWCAPPSVRPAHERRITEADEDEHEDADVSVTSAGSASSSESVGNPLAERRAWPALRARPALTPRRSPAGSVPRPMSVSLSPPSAMAAAKQSYRRSMVDMRGAAPDVRSMPVPIAAPAMARSSTSMSNSSKRRSLLGMPYYPSDTSDGPTSAEAPDLSRTTSLPISNLQHLRTLSATGGPRRPSLYSLPDGPSAPAPQSAIGLGFPFGRRPRVESVSPLTVAGLKASYLGVHLKRRRMACCLLGLDFLDPRAEQYWTDVADALGALTASIVDSAERLDAARAESEREADAARALADIAAQAATLPPPIFATQAMPGGADFAPRDPDAVKLIAHVSAIQAGLARLWAASEAAKQAAVEGEPVAAHWAGMREELGFAVRELERGREIVGRIDRGACADGSTSDAALEAFDVDASTTATGADDDDGDGLPEFVKAWEVPRPVLGFNPAGANSAGPLPPPEPEPLPPPGADDVYEATASAPVRRSALADLPRAERIRLTKEARAAGVPVAQLLGVAADAAAEGASGAGAGEHRRQEGEVVSELMGMMAMIRERKGVGAGDSAQDADGRAKAVSAASPAADDAARPTVAAPDRPGQFSLKADLSRRLAPDGDRDGAAAVGVGARAAAPRLDVRIGDVRRAFVFPPPAGPRGE